MLIIILMKQGYCEIRLDSSMFVNILLLAIGVRGVLGYSMMVSFCDGDRLVRLTHDQCPYGLNFGDIKPECVCIKGAYRMWLDNCAVYDGFMEESCSTLQQNEYSVTGLRLSGSIDSLLTGTGAIFGLKETDYQVFDSYKLGSKTPTTTNNVYVLNGDAYFIDNRICIQPKNPIPMNKQVCRVFRSDNPVWRNHNTTVEIVENCGEDGVKLEVHSCYDVLKSESEQQSECALKCRGVHPESAVIHGGAGYSESLPEKCSEDWDCTGPTPGEVRDDKNVYINRNLNRWAKLRQVKDVDRPNPLSLMPRRSWILFDMMKQITQLKCPSNFVSQLFLDQAMDLFIMVHQGKGNRYNEVLGEDDYQNIYLTLENCIRNIVSNSKEQPHLPMHGAESQEECGAFDRLVGVNISHPTAQGTTVTVQRIDVNQAFFKYNYHFVIEVAWKILDMVQNVCFDSFGDDYVLFHTWEQAMEKLFTREVRNLWFYPNMDVRVYQILLSPTAITDLYNLELCVAAVYLIDPRLRRLNRPRPISSYFRRKK